MLSFNSRTPGGVRPPQQGRKAFHQEFQFTHPGRGATQPRDRASQGSEVSIHAPREGCDIPKMALKLRLFRFNSRTPGGVRLMILQILLQTHMFQFTHPGRGAT